MDVLRRGSMGEGCDKMQGTFFGLDFNHVNALTVLGSSSTYVPRRVSGAVELQPKSSLLRATLAVISKLVLVWDVDGGSE